MKTFISNRKQRRCRLTIRGNACIRYWPRLMMLLAMGVVIFNIPMPAGAHQLVVGIDDHDTTVEMRVGEILQIDLPGNVGSGFEWQFDEIDETILTQMCGGRNIEREGEPGFVGNGYVQSWLLKAESPGNSTVRLLYDALGEGPSMAINELNIEVVVNP